MNATKITTQTLVCSDKEVPHRMGNCFSVLADDGNEYRVVNLLVENLEWLVEHGLSWPIPIRVVIGSTVIIHDPRIPSGFYRNDFCECCCPEDYLPEPQKLRIQREVLQGVRQYHGSEGPFRGISITMGKMPRKEDFFSPEEKEKLPKSSFGSFSVPLKSEPITFMDGKLRKS